MSEPFAYRQNLQDILEFFDGKRMLNYKDVSKFTGIIDNRTLRKRYPFHNGMISASTLAFVICGGGR